MNTNKEKKTAIEWIEPRKKNPKWKAKHIEKPKNEETFWENGVIFRSPVVRLTKSITGQRIKVIVCTDEDKVVVQYTKRYNTTQKIIFTLEQWKDLNEAIVEARDYLALTGV